MADPTHLGAATPPRTTLRTVCIIFTCTSAIMLNISNTTSIAIALPTIGRALDIPEHKLQWIVNAYALSSGCLLLMFGRIADIYGQKLVFTAGATFMAAFSLGCAFARDEITLNILRALQGVGAAAMIPAAIGILARAFPPSNSWRAIAFSCLGVGAPVGAAFGMVVGGSLVQYTAASWRSIFYLSTGLSLLCLLAGVTIFDKDECSAEIDRRVDWIGASLVTSALTLIVFALSEGEVAPHGWATAYIVSALGVGMLLLVWFLAWQYYLERVVVAVSSGDCKGAQEQVDPDAPVRTINAPLWLAGMSPPPLIKLSLWSRGNGRFGATMVVAFFLWASFLSWHFWILLYYQDFLHLSPIDTTVRMLPMFVVGLPCNAFVAVIVGRLSLWWLTAIGTTATTLAPLLLAILKPEASYWEFGFPAAILSVFGADFVFSAGTLYIAKLALPQEQSIAGASFQTMTQLGTALGLAITTIVYNRVLGFESTKVGWSGLLGDEEKKTRGTEVARLSAYQAAQWAAFTLGLLATLIAVVSFRGVGIIGHRPTKRTSPEDIVEGARRDGKLPNAEACREDL